MWTSVPNFILTLLTAHILFDEGIQCLLITEELARKLYLIRDKTRILYLLLFGDSQTSVRNVDVVTVYIQADTGESIPIHVAIIPVIAVPQKNRWPPTYETCFISRILS